MKKETDSKIVLADNEEQEIAPGECIGNWLEKDESCLRCEIWEDCKKMTSEIAGEDNSAKQKEEI